MRASTTMRRSAATPRAPSRSTTCCAPTRCGSTRGAANERRRRPPARRPPAPAARADRPHHRGVRRARPRSSAPIGQAIERFGDILPTLVRELPILRRPVGDAYPLLQGPVARRMAEAVWPHRAVFITPMAAVAGAVADEMLQALVRGRTLDKAYVNNGGDIALHLTPGHEPARRHLRHGPRRRGDASPTTSRCAASPPRAAAGARSRWASPTRRRCSRRPPLRPTPRRP